MLNNNEKLAILSVSQLNRHVRSLLEHEMGEVWVEGEVSNLSKPSSGHYYFTLKDTKAQIRCVYFRNRHTASLSALNNGQQIIASGRLSLYEARGDYQLIVEQLKEAGLGDLFRQFEILKNKLQAEGLFEASRKKPIPNYPDIIGIITSASGAALRDILTTLARRYPVAQIKIYPSEVQGKNAPQQLINAFHKANQENSCDVLLLARGGGSIEDLWAFNDEKLAHTISNSKIPIVVGVGHETDFTIADFVADLRAATPTAAAEAVTPDRLDLLAQTQTLQARLNTAIIRFIQHKKLLLNHEKHKISSPGQLILTHWQTLDYLRSHLFRTMHHWLSQKHQQINIINMRLQTQNPVRSLAETRKKLQTINDGLTFHMRLKIKHNKQKLAGLLNTLQAVSPLATLDRGYAIVTHNDKVLFDNATVNVGDDINIRLAKGELVGEVKKKK